MKSTLPIRVLTCVAATFALVAARGEPRFEISADGKSFVCTVPASGMVIIFR